MIEPMSVPPEVRARSLLTLLWRKLDYAGISMNRSSEAVLLELAMKLLGEPDLLDLKHHEDGTRDIIAESRLYSSHLNAQAYNQYLLERGLSSGGSE